MMFSIISCEIAAKFVQKRISTSRILDVVIFGKEGWVAASDGKVLGFNREPETLQNFDSFLSEIETFLVPSPRQKSFCTYLVLIKLGVFVSTQ